MSKALDERQAENLDSLRGLEGYRLDAPLASVWDKAMSGDMWAVNTAVKIFCQRVRLMGLGGGRAHVRVPRERRTIG